MGIASCRSYAKESSGGSGAEASRGWIEGGKMINND